MRPSEVAALGKVACQLPDNNTDAWGELVLSESRPEVGAGWTDDGLSHEKNGLKRRARKATCTVPIPPVLVSMLRKHLVEYGTAADGRLFQAAGRGRLRSAEYRRIWPMHGRYALTTAKTPATQGEARNDRAGAPKLGAPALACSYVYLGGGCGI